MDFSRDLRSRRRWNASGYLIDRRVGLSRAGEEVFFHYPVRLSRELVVVHSLRVGKGNPDRRRHPDQEHGAFHSVIAGASKVTDVKHRHRRLRINEIFLDGNEFQQLLGACRRRLAVRDLKSGLEQVIATGSGMRKTDDMSDG